MESPPENDVCSVCHDDFTLLRPPIGSAAIYDGKYILAGGEDDLVQFWSKEDTKIIGWGKGHNTWISGVAFDSFWPAPNSGGTRENAAYRLSIWLHWPEFTILYEEYIYRKSGLLGGMCSSAAAAAKRVAQPAVGS